MSCLWSRYQFKYFKSAPAVTSSVFMRRFRLYFWDSVREGDGRQALLWKQPTIQQFNKTIVLLVRNSLKISPLSKINLYFTTRENPFHNPEHDIWIMCSVSKIIFKSLVKKGKMVTTYYTEYTVPCDMRLFLAAFAYTVVEHFWRMSLYVTDTILQSSV